MQMCLQVCHIFSLVVAVVVVAVVVVAVASSTSTNTSTGSSSSIFTFCSCTQYFSNTFINGTLLQSVILSHTVILY